MFRHLFRKADLFPKTVVFLLLTAVLACSGCASPKDRTATADLFAMDTYITVSCFGEGDLDAVIELSRSEIYRLESLFDANSETSDIGRINRSRSEPVEVSDDTVSVLKQAAAVSALSEGSFNCFVRPLVELWGFSDNSPSLPDNGDILALLPVPDPTSVLEISGNRVSIPEGTGVDLGGIAKGYCSDRLSGIIRSCGVRSALLSLGGNIMAVGQKTDGTPWKIGIRDPENETSVIGIVSVTDRAVITSGSYQRRFEDHGTVYHHILDPETGYPSESGLVSVTVVSKYGTSADALSTALFVLGVDRSLAVLERLPSEMRPDGVIFVGNDGKISIYGDLDFQPTDAGTSVQMLRGGPSA